MWGAVVIGMLLLATNARAQEGIPARAAAAPAAPLAPSPPVPSASSRAFEDHWYGAPLLADDVVAAGALLLGAAVDRRFTAAGLLIGLLDGPIVHGLHHRPGAVTGSLVLRFLLVGGLASLGALGDGINDRGPPAHYAEKLAAFGLGVTSFIDVALVAWERVPVRSSLPVAIVPLGGANGERMVGMPGRF